MLSNIRFSKQVPLIRGRPVRALPVKFCEDLMKTLNDLNVVQLRRLSGLVTLCDFLKVERATFILRETGSSGANLSMVDLIWKSVKVLPCGCHSCSLSLGMFAFVIRPLHFKADQWDVKLFSPADEVSKSRSKGKRKSMASSKESASLSRYDVTATNHVWKSRKESMPTGFLFMKSHRNPSNNDVLRF